MSSSSEAYSLQVDTDARIVTITADEAAGVFYGIQTLLNMVDKARNVSKATINDAPRFEYRGFHLDVSRHFHRKDEVMTLLEIMSMYKLNKFHMHLTDDEGWRLQIPGLAELTEVRSPNYINIKDPLLLVENEANCSERSQMKIGMVQLMVVFI